MNKILHLSLPVLVLVAATLACEALPVPLIQDQDATEAPANGVPVTQAAPVGTARPLPADFPATIETDSTRMFAVLQSGDFSFFENFSVEQYEADDFARPGTVTFTVTMPATETIFLNYGWCAENAEILEQNLEHIDLAVYFNDQEIPEEYIMGIGSTTQDDWQCANAGFLLTDWDTGKYEFRTVVTFDEKINDGGADFEAGEYIMQFDVTVK
jgi:hypothetical protein